MRYAEVTKKERADLEKLEIELATELMKFRAQVATGAPGKDSGRVRAIKRDIARIKTEITKKNNQGGADKQ